MLLPLVNVPMLNYTLEWLAGAGVEEAFVFCCAHHAQIQEYLKQAGWLSMRSFVVHILVSQVRASQQVLGERRAEAW